MNTKLQYIIIILSITVTSNSYTQTQLVTASIDSVSLKEINFFIEEKKPTIYDYYKLEKDDPVDIWSEKLFGRCCSEADMEYSDLLYFNISTNSNNVKYPIENLTDQTYGSAFVLKENSNTEIHLKLDYKNSWHTSHTLLKIDEVLKSNDTLLHPFKLSLVNGYTKSEKTFKENGRVKELMILLNNNYKATVTLLDTPLVQQFEVDFAFFKDDTVTLKPITYYKGSKYKDICISEIQSSFSQITHESINKKFKIEALRKIGIVRKKHSKQNEGH